MSFTGSVLTPGCSNTTRVRFACSIFLVGLRHRISRPGMGLGAGVVPRRSTYPWAMHTVGASAGARVCVHTGVQGGVCMERGPCRCEPLQCTARCWAWAGTGAGGVSSPGTCEEGRWDLRAGAAGRVLNVQDHQDGLLVAVRSCRARVGCGTVVGAQWRLAGAGAAAAGLRDVCWMLPSLSTARDSVDQAMAAGSRLAPRDMEPGRRLHLFRQHPGHALYHLPHAYPQRNLRSFPPEPAHGNPFFHSPELSQLDFGTIHYMPYRPATSLLACGHPSPLAPGLLGQQHPSPSACGQTLPPHRTCSLQPQPPCLGLKAALAQKQHRAPALRRGVSHGHQHNSSGSGESYLTDHSGYLADGPGSDSSSGPCHGSSSDSMLNCTDVSLQGIHGSCSTFRSSLSSDYDPFVYCSSEGPATDNGQGQPRPPRETRPRSLDLMVPGGAAPAKPQVLSHVHYHHHQHHHYRRDVECPPGRAGQGPGQRKSRYSGAKVGFHGARPQKRTEKSHHCQQPLESSAVLQEAAPAGQPACSQQGCEPPHAPSASPNRLDFSVDANRQSGAAGTSPVPLPLRHSLQSRHHRRKRKCPLEPDPALLPEDSALPKACDAHGPHSHPTGYRCSPEVQPLIPSAPLPCGSGSRPLWKCLVPQSGSELKKQEEGLSGREGNRTVPADFSGTGTPRHSLSLHLHCPSQQGSQGKSGVCVFLQQVRE